MGCTSMNYEWETGKPSKRMQKKKVFSRSGNCGGAISVNNTRRSVLGCTDANYDDPISLDRRILKNVRRKLQMTYASPIDICHNSKTSFQNTPNVTTSMNMLSELQSNLPKRRFEKRGSLEVPVLMKEKTNAKKAAGDGLGRSSRST